MGGLWGRVVVAWIVKRSRKLVKDNYSCAVRGILTIVAVTCTRGGSRGDVCETWFVRPAGHGRWSVPGSLIMPPRIPLATLEAQGLNEGQASRLRFEIHVRRSVRANSKNVILSCDLLRRDIPPYTHSHHGSTTGSPAAEEVDMEQSIQPARSGGAAVPGIRIDGHRRHHSGSRVRLFAESWHSCRGHYIAI